MFRNKKILIIGASGDLGFAILEKLAKFDNQIGAHCYKNKGRLRKWSKILSQI